MQARPPGGFHISDRRGICENPPQGKTISVELFRTHGAARLSGARWCAIFPTLPKTTRNGDSAIRRPAPSTARVFPGDLN
jgi:hypothetical protein